MSRSARPRRLAGALALGGLQLVALGLLLPVGDREARADAAARVDPPAPAQEAPAPPADDGLAALLANRPAPRATPTPAEVDAEEPGERDAALAEEPAPPEEGIVQKVLPNPPMMGGY
jgi:hypothetical protein